MPVNEAFDFGAVATGYRVGEYFKGVADKTKSVPKNEVPKAVKYTAGPLGYSIYANQDKIKAGVDIVYEDASKALDKAMSMPPFKYGAVGAVHTAYNYGKEVVDSTKDIPKKEVSTLEKIVSPLGSTICENQDKIVAGGKKVINDAKEKMGEIWQDAKDTFNGMPKWVKMLTIGVIPTLLLEE